jgi:hypothetical protein
MVTYVAVFCPPASGRSGGGGEGVEPAPEVDGGLVVAESGPFDLSDEDGVVAAGMTGVGGAARVGGARVSGVAERMSSGTPDDAMAPVDASGRREWVGREVDLPVSASTRNVISGG